VAHVYVQDPARIAEVKGLIEGLDGVETVWDDEAKRANGLDHPRSGELVAIAAPDRWFSYYYWLDDDRAPDFAPTVEIHRKPGYDPAELFLDPDLTAPQLRASARLLQKKLGFRYVMDVIPTNGKLVKGSHGRLPDSTDEGPLLISNQSSGLSTDALQATDVHDVILSHLTGTSMEQVKSASRDQ
jgi:predicted AlkP superfamily pyrophosphatase or phosphodiesterase